MIVSLIMIGWSVSTPAFKHVREGKLPMSGLTPAKAMPDLCLYRYRVTTSSPQAQAYFDQGLGMYYSYVYVEAIRAFETALRHDPHCAMLWWGLSKAMEKGGKGDMIAALRQAKLLMPRADHREQMLITARLQEKGMIDGVTPDTRRSAAQKTLDELLVLHDDDQEAWFCRAQVSDGPAAIPYYKALLRINPLHPGANHELVHYYENIKRPALGWPYAEKYIESSPGQPHAHHMQAHLATRIGRWDKTTDWSAKAVELQMKLHQDQGIVPSEDSQFHHHLDILTVSLIHDGRFAEARRIKAIAEKSKLFHWDRWFHLHLAERNWADLQKVIDHHRKRDKTTGAYMAAIMYLAQGDTARASAEVDVLKQSTGKGGKRDNRNELRQWEAQGLLLCKTGAPDEGLKLLKRAVDKTMNDYQHHAWGHGAYYMEIWGLAALEAGRYAIAEEAFLESLAHDPGSVKAALGMQAICAKQGRLDEAKRYEALAKKAWRKADLEAFLALREHILGSRPPQITTTSESKIRTGSEE